MTSTRKAPRGKTRGRGGVDADFGPAPEPGPPPASPGGPIPGIACGGEGCVLKPVADLVAKFTIRLAIGHRGSLSRAAFSGIELMKALRDFLDEEIAIAEKAAGKSGAPSRFQKISVE